MAIMVLSLLVACTPQIQNATTKTVKVYGNCGMCESTIETAGNQKGISKVDWDKNSKMATLTYDVEKINQDAILKRIALSGYDSDNFLAPDATYTALPACCQYERAKKMPMMNMEADNEEVASKINEQATTNEVVQPKEIDLFLAVFAAYFKVKDALVQTDAIEAAAKASTLSSAINSIKMEKLPMDVHIVWMKIVNDLKQDANAMASSKEIETQRSHFINLSKNIYDLIKVSKYEMPVYYQFCPMANDGKGANWLSTENVVKNPYYGSMMLSCGKVVETIK